MGRFRGRKGIAKVIDEAKAIPGGLLGIMPSLIEHDMDVGQWHSADSGDTRRGQPELQVQHVSNPAKAGSRRCSCSPKGTAISR